MEEAVASCPGLFIEPGLTLIRRQVVINDRRPMSLFSDALARRLLVEIQCGRLGRGPSLAAFLLLFRSSFKISVNAPATDVHCESASAAAQAIPGRTRI